MISRPFLAAALALLSGLAATAPAAAQDDVPALTRITEAWLASRHADRSAEAFTHWNEDGEIPGRCAVCHSSTGFLSYLNGPMDIPGGIDHPVPPGAVVDCTACHSAPAFGLTEVPYPSGTSVSLPRGSAVCSVCHQGRASGVTLTAMLGAADPDTVSADLAFLNPHYALSAAAQQGGAARGGYEYEGRTYAGAYAHIPDLSTCASCHSPHSLKVDIGKCTSCHKDVQSFAEIRTSPVDFDGDGDTAEGISAPIATLHAQLGEAIALYAAEVAGTPIVHSPDAFPYFFTDSDGDGAVSEGEAAYPNRYQSWTPRLLRAAYNYRFVAEDGGAGYSHNPHYALQLLYDSLADLGQAVAVDVSALTRP